MATATKEKSASTSSKLTNKTQFKILSIPYAQLRLPTDSEGNLLNPRGEENYDLDQISNWVEMLPTTGVKVPLRVVENADGTFTILDGHRRYMMLELAQTRYEQNPEILAKLNLVPTLVVKDANAATPEQFMIGALLYNSGKNLDAEDKMRAIQALQQMGHTNEQIATLSGISLASVNQLSEAIKGLESEMLTKLISDGKITTTTLSRLMYGTTNLQAAEHIAGQILESKPGGKITESDVKEKLAVASEEQETVLDPETQEEVPVVREKRAYGDKAPKEATPQITPEDREVYVEAMLTALQDKPLVDALSDSHFAKLVAVFETLKLIQWAS